MTICFFGMYASKYSRNHILIKGLEENGVRIIHCNDRSHFIYGLRYLKLLMLFAKNYGWSADVIYVGFPGQSDVPLAWLLGKLFNKKLVFDAFYSLYVSQVFDRKNIKDHTWKSAVYWFADWLSCTLSDRVILDTQEHIKYFSKEFRIPKSKFTRIFVGTDTDIFKPSVGKHKGFIVGFHGSYLPLQGAPTILGAAKLLANTAIKFKLLGNGIGYADCVKIVQKQKIRNVEFLSEVPYGELPKFISGTDVYLGGPFGASLKSNQVIPNKVYESLAMQKPVVVGESMATRELLTHKVNSYFVPQGDPDALAEAILALQKNKLLREKIARGGYNLVQRELTPKKLARVLINIVHNR